MSTKDKIISVLVDLIKQDENINEVPISKIASLADIGKSTVYEYFTSKDELVHEVYKYLSDVYRERIVAPLQSQTFEPAFKEITSRIMSDALEANDLMMRILSEGHNIKMMDKDDAHVVMLGIQEELQTIYSDIIGMGIREGIVKFNPSEIKEKNHIIRALIVGVIMQLVNEQIDLSEADALNYIYKYTVLVLNA